jgi:hypothetical protein
MMNKIPNEAASDVTVKQADRDAAEAIYPAFLASLKGDEGGYGIAEAFARHRIEERAKIVAWCRNVNIYWCKCAYAIEEGEHLQEQSK